MTDKESQPITFNTSEMSSIEVTGVYTRVCSRRKVRAWPRYSCASSSPWRTRGIVQISPARVTT
jgi:hypothetical protein